MSEIMEFTDAFGRKWNLKLNMLIVNRIEKSDYKALGAEGNIDLLSLNDNTLRNIILNSKLMFGIIWTIVQDQVAAKYEAYKALPEEQKAKCKSLKLDVWPVPPENEEESQNEFISGVDGNTITAARNALIEGLADFFQEMKSVLYELREQMRLVRELIEKRSTKMREKIKEEIEKELDKLIQ